ncbi:MAG: (d)CMP kinase [Candidatus Pacebacteria bacterium]|nr:(d)CMP kinase [Candidatus Paceibacterota bacterium]
MNFHIAIDGPVAAGKGTISRLVAERLGYLYVDTGAMYRMTALLAVRNNIDATDEDAIANLVEKSKMEMRSPSEEEKDGRLSTIILDGEDVSWKIRTEQVSLGASKVAKLPKVRKILVQKQQEIAKDQSVIMEGRDITYRVLPNADLKIFLTGSDIIRARRRLTQLLTKGEDVSFEQILKDLVKRDKQDMTRNADPLKIVDDAIVIDTSDLSIQQVAEIITSKAHVMIENKKNA